MEEKRNGDLKAARDEAVLRQYGVRWAVLAAWMDALRMRRVDLPMETDRILENARIKIATGCFSVCEVGCDLSQLEAALTSIEASNHHNGVDFWVDMLGHSMSGRSETERILKIPSVMSHYNDCGVGACRC